MSPCSPILFQLKKLPDLLMSQATPYRLNKKGNSVFPRKGFIRLFALVLIFITSANSNVQAQQNVNYAIHANIIYRFTKYIDWPATYKEGDFVIGVVGETPLFDELKNFIANKSVGDQRIVVRRISASAASFNGHIIFIPDNENDKLRKFSAMTAGTSTLIVTESPGSAKKGSCISLAIVNEHLKMEINKNTIDQRHLSIAPELLQLGNIVK